MPPPGFPFLVGLAYLVFGVGDLPAILVSIAAGTLTIPVAAWLAGRTFGREPGRLAAAFAALSGAHVAFSRMALTDASFLLFWLLAIGHGPAISGAAQSACRAVLLGLAVGAAQLFKYNGWIAGAFVVLAAAVWLLRTLGSGDRGPPLRPGAGALWRRLSPRRSTGHGSRSSKSHGGYAALPGTSAQLPGRCDFLAGSLVAPACPGPGTLRRAGLAGLLRAGGPLANSGRQR